MIRTNAAVALVALLLTTTAPSAAQTAAPSAGATPPPSANSGSAGGPPGAAPAATDVARSEGLFKEATFLLESGHVALACPKFLESQKLAPGIGVSLYLADCYERVGKVASAWKEFRNAEHLSTAKKDARATIAKNRAATLEPQLSTLTIDVPANVRVPGLKIVDEGNDVVESRFGKAEPSDPGPHRIVVEAPRHRKREYKVTVPPKKGAATVTIEALVPGEEETAAPAIATAPTPQTAGPREAPPAAAPRDGKTQRFIGIGVGAAGIVATGVGLVFGLAAQSKLDESNEAGRCNAQDFCTPEGLALRSDAGTAATVSTIFVGVGLAAIAGGLVLYFTAPRSGATTATRSEARVASRPSLSPTPTGLLVRF